MTRIGFICPVYDAVRLHAYTVTSILSFLATTPGGVVIVIDDGSPKWTTAYEQKLRTLLTGYPHAEMHISHYSKQGGLTRSWNTGLKFADGLNLDYAIAGNNDIVFSPRWYAGLIHATQNGYALVGPLSNAPGITAKGLQEVWRYVADYQLTDAEDKIKATADSLYEANMGKIIESRINGFFQFASLPSWRAGKYDANHYYRPLNTHTAGGQKNPTPTMTLNEDELQTRWAAKGMRSAIVLSSFIFHYRAVSRGDRYKRGKWYRKK